jgi:hypothetical protein
MSSSDEYRQYAQECIDSARSATSEEVRKHFLELAKMWMTAAQQIEDGMSVPLVPDRTDNPHTH